MLSRAAAVMVLLGATIAVAGAQARTPYQDLAPGGCALAPILINGVATRELIPADTYTPKRDTTSAIARDSVGMCSAFGGDKVNDWELLNQGRVQLILGRDSLAARATAEYLRLIPQTAAQRRAWALHLIVLDNLGAQRARFDAAGNAMRQLHALGAPAAKARYLAHNGWTGAAIRYHDESSAIAHIDSAVAEWRGMKPEWKERFAVMTAQFIQTKAEIVLRNGGIAQARAVIDSGLATIPARDYRMANGSLLQVKRMYAVLGKPGVPVGAKWWYPTPREFSGRTTLLAVASHGCGQQCHEKYRGLGRFGARFPNDLDIVNLAQTHGFLRDTAPVSPADEAVYDSAYFFGKHKLPGTLGIYETDYFFLPDGRRRDRPTPKDVAYGQTSIVIIDKRRVVRYVGEWSAVNEELLAAFVARLVAEP